MLPYSAAQALTSRAFVQELGLTLTPGQVSLDLYNNTGVYVQQAPSQFRGATNYGEVILSPDAMGFKTAVYRNLAAYFNLGASSNANETKTLDAGLAYRIAGHSALININPVLHKSGATSMLGVNTAIFLRAPPGDSALGELQFGAEAGMYEQGMEPLIAAGVRWLPRPFFTVDLILIGRGGSYTQTVARTPAALRINVGF